MSKDKVLSPELIEDVRNFIRHWSHDLKITKADMLCEVWSRFDPSGTSQPEVVEQMRQEKLKRWIADSKDKYVAWEGCRRLLKKLREKPGDEHLPDELLIWALDVACGRIEKPTLPQGSHITDNTIRNELLQFFIDLCCFLYDITLEQAKELVSLAVHLEFETVDKIYKEQKRIKAPDKKWLDDLIVYAEKEN